MLRFYSAPNRSTASTSSKTLLRVSFVILFCTVVVTTVESICTSSGNNISNMSLLGVKQRTIPDKVIIGYTVSNAKSSSSLEKVTRAIESGVNVVIWSFIRLEAAVEENGDDYKPIIKGGPSIPHVKEYKLKLEEMGYGDTLHLVAFGGWNGPHLNTDFSSERMYQAWKQYGGDVFDGFDWDLEGEDNLLGPGNYFTMDVLDRMGEMSSFAKKDGYIVTMAPAESYLDISTSEFSRYVNLTYDEDWHPEFQYHGRNVYAYVLAKWPDSIDLVSVQFYESYSHAAYHINHLQEPASTWLVNYVEQLKHAGEGYRVNFQTDREVGLEDTFISLPLEKLVIGLANGWADKDKVVFFGSTDLEKAYTEMERKHCSVKGFMFWVS